jgi:hypothetical protein
MAVDFIMNCFSTNFVNSSNSIQDYFEDFSIKNPHLPVQFIPQKYNRNFIDKLFLLRFSFYEKILTSRALCTQDQGHRKFIYSIIAIPSLMLDIALNAVVFNSKQIYRLPLIKAIGVNLLYKKITQGKNFEYSSSIESVFHTLINVVGVVSSFEMITLTFNAIFLNKDPFSTGRKSWLSMEMPLALFWKGDGTYTIAFSKARYSSVWKNHSDEKIYELLKETCPKFRYSVDKDMIRVYEKVGSGEFIGLVASLKKKESY